MSVSSRAKQQFEEATSRRAKFLKKVYLLVFCILGTIFIIQGLFQCVESIVGFFIFFGIGGFLILVGVLLFLLVPTEYDYEKFKQRSEKLGYINFFLVSAIVSSLEKQFEELVEENESLERRIKELESKVK